VVVVLRVDKEKGYIDLSKRRVSPEEIQKCEEKYNKSKAVHSIMRHVAETTQKGLEDLYVQFGWPLYRKFGHAYDAFKLAISDPEVVFKDIPIEPDIKSCLIKNIQRRLTPQPVKIRADIEVTCFQYEGIDAIKAALRAGEDAIRIALKAGDEAMKALHVGEEVSKLETTVSVKLVAPPLYVMVGTFVDKDQGVVSLSKAIEVIKEELVKRKGELTVKVAPRCVSERDELELASIMETLNRQNTEVSGDDDISDEEDTGMGPAAVDEEDEESTEKAEKTEKTEKPEKTEKASKQSKEEKEKPKSSKEKKSAK